MASEVERKQFRQTFIDRIDIFPERREDGNWIKNISFKFYVPVMKEGKSPANIKGITLDKEDNIGDLVPLEKLMTLESVVQLSKGDIDRGSSERSDAVKAGNFGMISGYSKGNKASETTNVKIDFSLENLDLSELRGR